MQNTHAQANACETLLTRNKRGNGAAPRQEQREPQRQAKARLPSSFTTWPCKYTMLMWCTKHSLGCRQAQQMTVAPRGAALPFLSDERKGRETRGGDTSSILDQHILLLTRAQTSHICVHEVHIMCTSYEQTEMHLDNDVVTSFGRISKSHTPHCRHCEILTSVSDWGTGAQTSQILVDDPQASTDPSDPPFLAVDLEVHLSRKGRYAVASVASGPGACIRKGGRDDKTREKKR